MKLNNIKILKILKVKKEFWQNLILENDKYIKPYKKKKKE